MIDQETRRARLQGSTWGGHQEHPPRHRVHGDHDPRHAATRASGAQGQIPGRPHGPWAGARDDPEKVEKCWNRDVDASALASYSRESIYE